MDPGLARGEIHDDEVTMSSIQFGDAQGPVEGQPAVPLQPLQPLVVAPAAPEPAAPVAPPAPAPVEPVPAPAEPVPAVPVNDMRDVPLGTLVFRAGLLPEEQLEEALQEGMKTGKRLGEILLERGLVSETDLGRLLAAQKGLPFVELDPSALDPTAPPLLASEKARLHGALPIGFEAGVPVVAVADPSNDLVVENVRRALACEPVLVVAGRDALMRAIDHAYANGVPAQPAPEPQPVAVEPVSAPVAAEPVATPVAVEPVAAPVAVEPVAAPSVEPVAAPVVEQPAIPVVEPQPAPVVTAEPVVAAEPVVPVAPEPAAPTPPVAPPPVVEPVAPVQPAPSGEGIWLGQPQEAQAPQVAPVEPVASTPEPVPAAPVVEVPVEPVVAHEPEPVVEPAPVVEPTADPVEELTWSVVLRLADGDRVEIGSYPGEEAATEGAQAVVAQIVADGSWPFVAGRFIRPEGIVSVDLVEREVSKWLGSSVRAAALGHDQPTA